MERAELSEALRPWRSRAAAGPAAKRAILGEAAPEKFMAAFATAAAGTENIFLFDPRWGTNELAQATALAAAGPPEAATARGYVMIPTGGTSGRVRFARHDAATISAAVRGFTEHFSMARVNAAGVLPLHHVSGLMAWMRAALTGGAYLPLDWKSVEQGRRPELPARADGWTISLVPTQLERLLREDRAVAWLEGFRLICLGGAPASPELLDRAAARRLPVSPGYGLTESAAMVAALRPADFLTGARGCGPPLPHVAVAIAADGAITLRGASLFHGYFPEWRAEEVFVTSDAGRLDDHGHLHPLGRLDAVVVTGGEKVNPSEIEAVIRGTGELREVVVVGVPDQEWGEVLAAVYPAAERPELSRLASAIDRALAPAKRPKHYVPVAAWPANAQGKVNRDEIARAARQILAR